MQQQGPALKIGHQVRLRSDTTSASYPGRVVSVRRIGSADWVGWEAAVKWFDGETSWHPEAELEKMPSPKPDFYLC